MSVKLSLGQSQRIFFFTCTKYYSYWVITQFYNSSKILQSLSGSTLMVPAGWTFFYFSPKYYISHHILLPGLSPIQFYDCFVKDWGAYMISSIKIVH